MYLHTHLDARIHVYACGEYASVYTYTYGIQLCMVAGMYSICVFIYVYTAVQTNMCTYRMAPCILNCTFNSCLLAASSRAGC